MDNKNDSATPFLIKCANQSFTDKQKSVFDQLEIAERNAKNLLKNKCPLENDGDRDDKSRIHRSDTKYLRGKESIFKRPEAPISRCLPLGRVPDFRKNPQKWTKYTLEDVKDEDMSEKSNTSAALSFLKELEDRRNNGEEEKLESLPSKIQFKKTALIQSPDDNNDQSTSTFKSSKVVMQEYVVGQKIKKDKRSKDKHNANVSKQLKLNHLFEEDDE